jgi:hypothetical protein
VKLYKSDQEHDAGGSVCRTHFIHHVLKSNNKHMTQDARTVDGWLGGPASALGGRFGRSLSDRQDGGADMHDAEDYGAAPPKVAVTVLCIQSPFKS